MNTTVGQPSSAAATLGNPGGTTAAHQAWRRGENSAAIPAKSVSSTGDIDARSSATTVGNDVTYDSLTRNTGRATFVETTLSGTSAAPSAITGDSSDGDQMATTFCTFATPNCRATAD